MEMEREREGGRKKRKDRKSGGGEEYTERQRFNVLAKTDSC